MREVIVIVATLSAMAATYTAIMAVGTIIEDWVARRRHGR